MISLRDLQETDQERLYIWRNLPEVRQWMYTDHEIKREEHQQWFTAALVDPTRKYWVIEIDSSPVGIANLSDINLSQGRCSWAFYLADPQVRGKGVGAATEFLVLEYVFSALGLNRLMCEVLLANQAVIHLHANFGFQIEGQLRQHVRKDGQRVDVVILGQLREEWLNIRAAAEARLTQRGLI